VSGPPRPLDAPGRGPAADPEAGPVARLEGIAKRFRRADGAVVAALDDVSLVVPPGEIVVLVGPSGCGKTTLLRAVAGLETPDAGVVEIHGRRCFDSASGTDVPPERRAVSMVFQNYALWPHLTAAQNVAYPLRANRRSRRPRADAHRRARELLDVVGIGDLADQHPHQMSGGQRQRVALARALVAGSDLVLFDEPLSNVDAQVRTQLRRELLTMQRELGFAALFVTHDQAEAMELADRIAVMGCGRLVQLGTPREVYDRPATRYVARFIGSANELAGRVAVVDGETVHVETAAGMVSGRQGVEPVAVGQHVVAVWRPEATRLSEQEPITANRWSGTTMTARYLGTHTEYLVAAAGHRLLVWQPGAGAVGEGRAAWVSVEPAAVRVMLPGGADVTDPAGEPTGAHG
jgi:iron(III) transport system ATP-binding protein